MSLEREKKKRLDKFIERIKNTVDPAMEELLNHGAGRRFAEAVFYSVQTGGKRLRPALVFLSTSVLGGKEEDVVHLAAATEILHNYTLIIDDIIDNSDIRRGYPTVWKKWGMAFTECVGIHYSASIFRGPLKCPYPSETSLILADALQILVEGEIIDVLQEKRGRDDELFVKQNRYKKIEVEDSLEMMSKKTAELFKACCALGGVCANGKKEEIEHLEEYGFNLGMAFQVRDDILDIFGDEKKFGKKIGKDIEERKDGNIVILFAMQETKGELAEILARDSIKDKDIKEAIEIIKKTGARERAIFLCKNYVEKAKDSLYKLPKNEKRDIMEDVVDYLAEREK